MVTMETRLPLTSRVVSLSRVLGVVAFFYVILAVFCACGVKFVPFSVQRAARSYFWMFGPPANLVWGTNYIGPFAVGTVAVAGLVYAYFRAQTTELRVLLGALLIFVWSLFGFISYAPAA